MSVECILLGTLATFGLSSLLYYWSGFDWLRQRCGVYYVDERDVSVTFWGRQLQCFWCVVVWVSVPISVLTYLAPLLLLPLAYTGGAILLAKGGRIIWRSMTDG